MNGQMYQIATIVASAKRALQTNEQIRYTPLKYENSIKFDFIPQKKLLRTVKFTAQSVSEWFEQLKKNELEDIKLLCPYEVENRNILGFSNTTQSMILCFFKNSKVTYFVPNWEFDSKQGHWNILYTEQEWANPPSEKPHFENNTAQFRKVLVDIKDLANRIESENFAEVFGRAIKLLDGDKELPDKNYGLNLPQIPDKNLQLFEAVSISDVFGAMGSWNDTPPYIAHEKGLSKEYDELSDELLKNIRLAILYSINEL